jgi:plasmid stability protein
LSHLLHPSTPVDSNAIITGEDAMSQLVVRNVDVAVVKALKMRAAAKGRSAEAEHREILRDVLTGARPSRSFKEMLLAIPAVGTDRDLAPRRGRPRAVRL